MAAKATDQHLDINISVFWSFLMQALTIIKTSTSALAALSLFGDNLKITGNLNKFRSIICGWSTKTNFENQFLKIPGLLANLDSEFIKTIITKTVMNSAKETISNEYYKLILCI